MKVGIRKVQENEWLVHIGFANMHLDRFSVELLAITLEHVRALEHGETHSILNSYVQLALRIKELDDKGLQRLTREVESQDLLELMVLAQDTDMNERIMKNLGSMVAKQLRSDLIKADSVSERAGKEAVKRVIETMFALETQGIIEFYNDTTQYI
jgi:flagellar motor switch protein FliG